MLLPRFKKPHIYKLYADLQKVHTVASTFPLLQRINEHTAETKDGSLVRVYDISGQDYTGLTDQRRNDLAMIRSQLFAITKARASITIHSAKQKTTHTVNSVDTGDICSQIQHKWESGFTEIYRTAHHLVLTVSPQNAVQKAAAKVEQSLNQSSTQILDEVELTITSKLSEFGAVRLEGEQLSSFFATLLNARPMRIKSRIWDNTLVGHSLVFDRKCNYYTSGHGSEKVFAAYISIQGYPEELSDAVLHDVYGLDADITITQSFSPLTKESSESIVRQQERQANINEDLNAAETAIELKKELDAEKLTLCKHFFCVEVLARSEAELDFKTQSVRKAIESHGLPCIRETVAIEPLFWSRFPTLEYLNTRARIITNHNAADLATFEKIGEGFETSSFGDRAVTHFPNTTNGLYSFNFHETPSTAPDILGHTMVIGGSSSGKSTLIMFLINNCMNFDNFKAILFDSLRGLKVFTNMVDGDYLDFSEGVEINPLQLKDTDANRVFLSRWLCNLAEVDEKNKEQTNLIADIVRRIFNNLDEKTRTLDGCKTWFKEDNDLFERMTPWLEGGNYGHVFNAKRDAFSFDKQLVAFDATELFEEPAELAAVTDLMFHKYMSMISETDTPNIMFFDESPRYFQNPRFAVEMIRSLQEVRKKRSVVILAAQHPSNYTSLPDDMGAKVIANMANLIIYPDTSATKAHYIDFLGLNEAEFKWVKEGKKDDSYQVLFKRVRTGESVILDVDLSRLNNGDQKLLKAFNTNNRAVLELEKLKAEHPTTWKQRYLS
jgi:ComB4 competence protein